MAGLLERNAFNVTNSGIITPPSALVYTAFFLVVDKLTTTIAKNGFPKHWAKMDHDTRVKIGSSITSSVHAIIVCAWILGCLFFDPSISESFNTPEKRVFGGVEVFREIFSFLFGFIVYDTTVIFALERRDMSFLAHHFAVLLCSYISVMPFTQYGTTLGILFELSTPILNMRNLLLSLGYKGTPLLKRVEQAFGITFILVRLCWGVPFSLWCVYETVQFYDRFDTQTKYAFYIVATGNVLLNSLNIFWTSKMLKMAFPSSKQKSN